MEIDVEDLREAPKNWREYFTDIKETGRICAWVARELSTPRNKRWIRQLVIGLLLATIFQLVQPRMVSAIFNGVVTHDKHMVIFGISSFMGCIVVQKVCDYFTSTAREWLVGLSWIQLDNRISKQMFEKSLGQHMHQSSSLNSASIDKARWKIIELEAMMLFEGIPQVLSLVFAYSFLWILSPVAGSIMTLVLALYALWMFYLNQKVMQVCVPLDKEFRAINRHRVERWEKVERVRVSAKEMHELHHMNTWFERIMESDRTFWLWYIKHSTARGIVSITGQCAIMAYGAWLVWSGQWEIGFLYPLYSWAARVSDNIWQIGHIEHKLNWSMPSIRSLREALSLIPDIVDKPNAVEIKTVEPPRVIFDNVSYHYPLESSSDKTPVSVLTNITFTIEPGEKVAIIGSSGAGKTTVMRLLMRFMDPSSGSIKIGEHDLTDIKLSSWMESIGYIPQQAQIFDGSIRYNLLYGCDVKRTDEELWSLMKRVKLDWKARLSDGLDTLVGKNGLKLSGGQAQRLMIGAAVAKKPSFMIIDEATSSLDSTTEKAVQRGLEQVLKGNVSALVVAHRLSTVRHMCNKFVVLKQSHELTNGDSQIEAVASSFEELVKQSPTFCQLAHDQGIVIH